MTVESVTESQLSRSVTAAQRRLYWLLGVVATGLGFIGMVVPVMPTTVFFIIAVWAFKRSSPRLESWLLNHPVFGATLRDWELNKCMRPRTKRIAITMIWLAIGASMTLMVYREKWVVASILLVTAISLTAYIATRNETPAPQAQ